MNKQRGKKITKLFLSALCFFMCSCDSVENHEHVFEDKLSFGSTRHFKKCTYPGCTVTKDAEKHTISADRVCTVCGYSEDTCSFYDSWDCQHFHEWSDWIVTEKKTCVDLERLVRYCTVCGAEQKAVNVPDKINGHDYIYDTDSDKEPTCTEDGYRNSKVCILCGEKLKGERIDATGHDFGPWEIITAATETTDGERTRTCKNCSYCETETYSFEVPPENRYPVENYYGGYYTPIVSWENGNDLKNQLHSLITTNFTGLVYKNNWETNQMAEQSLTDFTKVNVVYSQKDDKKTSTYGGAGGAAGWQREHAFCASLMTSYLTSEAVNIASNGASRATDFHNLFAAYGAANGGRGNKNFGNYNPLFAGEGTSAAVDADTRADVGNFEPNDCDKGRLARAIFYMGVMYNQDETSKIGLDFKKKDGGTTTINVDAKYRPIRIVEDYVNFSQITFTDFVTSTDRDIQKLRNTYLKKYREDTSAYTASTPESSVLEEYGKAYSDYKYNEYNFAIGNLSTLIDWNSKPVDRAEMWHNEVVYSYVHQNDGPNKGKKQGNRNPFVDYPELVDYVYGSKSNEAGYLADLRPSQDALETNNNDAYNYALTSYKVKYLVGETLTNADYSFVRVNNDFTTQEADFTDTNESYTFAEADIGQKTITLTTPKGNVSYIVNVESSGGANACNYKFDVTKSNFSSTSLTDTPAKILSYSGTEYYVSAKKSCSVSKATGNDYVKIGTEKDHADELIIKSAADFTYDGKGNISSIYVGLNTASGKTYKLELFVGEDKVCTTNFSYNKGGPLFYGEDFESKTGPIKIVISNADAAIHLSGIYVKVN